MTSNYKNLEKAWSQVTKDDIEVGEASYPAYQLAMKNWAYFYNLGFVQVTEAFVALSPNNDYHGNLRSLSAVCFSVAADIDWSNLSVSTYRACGDRAISYLNGTVCFSDTVKGLKIKAFRDNILYLSNSRRVTVDGHMVSLWMGQDNTMKESAAAMSHTLYLTIEKDIKLLANRVNRAAHEVQAILWVSRKRIKAINFKEQRDLFTGMNRWQEVPKPEDFPPYQLKAWRAWNNRKVTNGI